MTGSIAVRIEWLDAPDVTAPELAATWARYELWVGDSCASQVETDDGTLRRSVYGSVYPLAEWIASNWWSLKAHVRPSATDSNHWSWENLRTQSWLRNHNMRGAGDGMSWPNLTIVPQGAMTLMRWAPDTARSFGRVRFVSSGSVWVQTDAVQRELASVVDRVIERMAENEIMKSRLVDEWNAIAGADEEERDFCLTVAQLGLNPYSIDDGASDLVIATATSLPEHLRAEFFDNVNPDAIAQAASWAHEAEAAADLAAVRANNSLDPLQQTVQELGSAADEAARPWEHGYSMARAVRGALGLAGTDRFPITDWVGVGKVQMPSGGLEGFITVNNRKCGLVLDGPVRTVRPASRFRQAKALGRVLEAPSQRTFLLSRTGYHDRVAGAFAAELMAPADGIRKLFSELEGEYRGWTIEEIAQRFEVSPMVVHHQYENQIAR